MCVCVCVCVYVCECECVCVCVCVCVWACFFYERDKRYFLKRINLATDRFTVLLIGTPR